MPTEYRHRLVVEGPSAALERFRADDTLWSDEPWRGMFGVTLEESSSERLAYRYDDDYKRPSPPVADMAAAYPDLTFVQEGCDEFGDHGTRARYVGGTAVESGSIDPHELTWIEWEEE